MSEAERLADDLDAEFVTGRISNHTGRKAAAELRRLSAENEALRKALQGVASMSRCGQLDEFIGEPWLNAVFAALAARPGGRG